MKKFNIVILIFIMIFMLGASLPDEPQNYAVLDQAGVLSPTTIDYLVNRNNELFDLTGGDVRFLITDFIPMGYEIADYTLAVFNHWGVGSADRNNGVLVVIAIGTMDFWVTAGSGLSQQMSASYLQNVTADYFDPYFTVGNHDMAVRNLFDALAGRIYELFPPEAGAAGGNALNVLPTAANPPQTGNGFGNVLGMIIFIFIALFVIRTLIFPRRRGWGGGMTGRRGFWGRPRGGGFGGMAGGFLGGYLMGRARHRQRPPAPPRGGSSGGTGRSGGGFTRGGSSRGGGFGSGGGGLGGGFGGGGGRSGGGFTRGGSSRGGGFGGRRR